MSDNQEVTFQINKVDYSVRPTFKAVSRIESKLGKSMLALANELTESKLSITEIAQIIYLASLECDNSPTIDVVGEYIIKKGVVSFIAIVGEYLANSLTGSKELEAVAIEEAESGN